MIPFRVAVPFWVGGDWRIRGGVLGMKAQTSKVLPVTAAFWQEQLNRTHVIRCTSCSSVLKEAGNSWSTSPGLSGKPFWWMS